MALKPLRRQALVAALARRETELDATLGHLCLIPLLVMLTLAAWALLDAEGLVRLLR